MWISKREYNFLNQQLEYYRTQAERERRRADELANNLLMTNGLPPATGLERPDPSPEDHPRAIQAKLKHFMAEMLNEETMESINDGEGSVPAVQ